MAGSGKASRKSGAKAVKRSRAGVTSVRVAEARREIAAWSERADRELALLHAEADRLLAKVAR
jgi:hypothetical protein